MRPSFSSQRSHMVDWRPFFEAPPRFHERFHAALFHSGQHLKIRQALINRSDNLRAARPPPLGPPFDRFRCTHRDEIGTPLAGIFKDLVSPGNPQQRNTRIAGDAESLLQFAVAHLFIFLAHHARIRQEWAIARAPSPAFEMARRLRRSPVDAAHGANNETEVHAQALAAYPAAPLFDRAPELLGIHRAKFRLAIQPGDEPRHDIAAFIDRKTLHAHRKRLSGFKHHRTIKLYLPIFKSAPATSSPRPIASLIARLSMSTLLSAPAVSFGCWSTRPYQISSGISTLTVL